MRRLSACLMIATLLVALVPSATSAAPPPPPGIDSIVAVANGDSLTFPGKCAVEVTVAFHGRNVAYVQLHQTGEAASWYADTTRKSYTVNSTAHVALSQLGSSVIWFQALLLNRRHEAFVENDWKTAMESWSGTACPTEGTLASWTASS